MMLKNLFFTEVNLSFMKTIITIVLFILIIPACKKNDNYHFASLGMVSIAAYNDCGLILCIDTDNSDGTDICTHPLNLDSQYEFRDTLHIEYRLTGDTFKCSVLGSPYFGERDKSYPIVEILNYK